MKKNLRFIAGLLVMMLISGYTFSQPFTQIETEMIQVTFSQVNWVDYDNDGDMDAFVFGMDFYGTYATALYKNDGNDTFTEVTATQFEDVAIGSHAWGDYDNDGDMDLLMQGANNSVAPTVILYQNQGNDVFTEAAVSLLQVYNGSARWVDYNNDGYLDIFLTGFDDVTYVTKMYLNNHDGTFSEDTSTEFPGMINSTVEWADYDKDGDMDFIFMGIDFSSNFVTTLYRNDGNGVFADAGLVTPGVWLGDAAWGDYDMDGFTDLIISGFEYPGRITNLYHNNGDGTFTLVEETPFVGVSHSALEWGDYDNDGDPDLFLAGAYEESGGSWAYVTYIYNNNGDGTFTESGINFATPLYWGDAAWGDYDNDGDLDIIQSGYTAMGDTKTFVFRNDNETANTPPLPPSNLAAQPDSSMVVLNWDAGSDNETPAEGLSYNAYLYKQFYDTIWSPGAMISGGYRLVPALGNVTQNTSWKILGLGTGTYFWSVQSVDNGFAGSQFAAEGSFTIELTGVNQRPAESSVEVSPNPAVNFINISAKHKINTVTVFNRTGQKVLGLSADAEHCRLNVEGLPSGLYLLHIETSEGVFYRKAIVR